MAVRARLDPAQTMQVTVRLYATLGRNRQGEETLQFDPGASARDVLKALGIPEDRVTLVFINGRHAEADQELREGDTIAFFPPVGGGSSSLSAPSSNEAA